MMMMKKRKKKKKKTRMSKAIEDLTEDEKLSIFKNYQERQQRNKKKWIENSDPIYESGIKKCNSKLTALINNERNSRIRYLSGSFRVKDDEGKEKVYTGLHRFLHRNYYPNTNERYPDKQRKSYKYFPTNVKRSCETYGEDHGILVHSQIEMFLHNNFTLESEPDYIDPCTLRIIRILYKRNWLPICSELAIFDETLKVATSIDLLVFDVEEQKLYLIELKTGYECENYGPLQKDEGLENPILKNVKNCPYNRHALQVLYMKMIVQRKYNVKIDDSFIILTRSKHRDAQVIPVPHWGRDGVILRSMYESHEKSS